MGMRGIQRRSPFRLIPSILQEWARVATAREEKDQTSLFEILRMRGRTYAGPDTGGASKSRDYCEICLLSTTMPTSRCIVVLIHGAQSQVTMVRYDDTRRVAGNG